MTIENKTHRAAFTIKTLSVIVLTAAELQADDLTITATGCQKQEELAKRNSTHSPYLSPLKVE